VQDLTFLERVRRQAEELGLRGWVRNTEDGRVEVLLEGEAEAVRQMIEWFFSASSSGVEVHATSVFQEIPSPDLVGFEIR
jgi:acylphosphatase